VRYVTGWRDDLRQYFGGNGELIAVAVVVTATLIATQFHYFRMPGVSHQWQTLWKVAGRGAAFLVVPLLSLIFLKIPLRELGFNWGRPSQWLKDVALLYVIMLPLLVIASRQPAFRATYPYLGVARNGPTAFLLAQAAVLFFMFGWEFIMRGCLLFPFFKKLGGIAIAIQMIPFALMHLGKPELEAYGSIIAGLALGIVALRAKSFYPCVVLHFAVAATLDLLSVIRI
jgi:uncharacterized protein